ncbi:hypothetical protein MGG_17778 [Pyricularia oryzae 70-15]|uniref:Uncharacterized protein n=1 Tax=Pyricularia oryzae (strain 70-15 / ATCC MYA-4617 / FGSC 8958) TaxID=242507 RepID=G4NHT2_PYRO7|nr:uncharacterized protein MGG_17778 [Pyricularia oryzae 70-15]EHA47792.1 hypothetical protein MGG_17778 [Pyricularia oryzae 70-15]
MRRFRSYALCFLFFSGGRLTQEKKKLELQESEVEDEILRLQRASTAAFNRLLRLRK